MKNKKLTKRDKQIIDHILTYIGLNTETEDVIAKSILERFDITPDEFSEWLSKTEV